MLLPLLLNLAGGVPPVTGTGAGTFPALEGSAAGVHGVSGVAAGDFPALVGAAAGAHGVTGAGAGTFPALVGEAAGAHGVAGVGAGSFPALEGEGIGAFGGDFGFDGQFYARGQDPDFPRGVYRRKPEWSWLWQQLVFCLPFNDPVMESGIPFFSDGNKFQCWDVGPERVGSGGRALGIGVPVTRNVPNFYTTAVPSLAGNVGIRFNNGNGAASTYGALDYLNVNGGQPMIQRNTGDGFTLAMVYTNTQTNGTSRRLFMMLNSFLGILEAVNITPTSINWQTFITNHVVSTSTVGIRSTFVFTGRYASAGGTPVRSIYQNGRLLGSVANAPIGHGDQGIRLGTNGVNENGSANGHLELLLTSNRYWGPDRVAQWSAAPFTFLEMRPRRRRFEVPVPPFVPGPPACLTAGLDVNPRAAAGLEVEPQVRAFGPSALARVHARAESLARARAGRGAGSRARGRPGACKPER